MCDICVCIQIMYICISISIYMYTWENSRSQCGRIAEVNVDNPSL